MTLITAETEGYLYILCFERAIGNPENRRALASHYLGWAMDLPGRLAQHASGHGSALTQAVVAQGIGWRAFYKPGTPALERWYKARYKSTPSLCPHCAASRGRRDRFGFQPLDQLAIAFAPIAFPDPPKLRADWLEYQILRGWRANRPAIAPAGIDDDLL